MSRDTAVVLILLFVGTAGGMTIHAMVSVDLQITKHTNRAVQQCEAELPRHLSCEPVYGAKVKEEGDE